jgi:NAD(P)-dependent dehydrogenase (short-subunit alcohol dehydrogenase family)
MKTVIITGISRGIGKALAEKFLNEGWKVIGISQSGISPLQNNEFEVFKTDIANSASIREFINHIEKLKLRIDVLINNAGISVDKSQAFSVESLRKTLEVNLFGLIDLTENLLSLINANGHIINLSSGLGSLTKATNGYAPAYRISKAAVNMYTRTLAARLISRNITVSSVDPGWVKTDMGGQGANLEPLTAAEDIYKLVISKVDSGFFWHRGKKTDW